MNERMKSSWMLLYGYKPSFVPAGMLLKHNAFYECKHELPTAEELEKLADYWKSLHGTDEVVILDMFKLAIPKKEENDEAV